MKEREELRWRWVALVFITAAYSSETPRSKPTQQYHQTFILCVQPRLKSASYSQRYGRGGGRRAENGENPCWAKTRLLKRARNSTVRLVSFLVSWCFKHSQPLRITSGLRETFIKRYIVERTSKAEIRLEGTVRVSRTKDHLKVRQPLFFPFSFFFFETVPFIYLYNRTLDQRPLLFWSQAWRQCLWLCRHWCVQDDSFLYSPTPHLRPLLLDFQGRSYRRGPTV